MRKVIILLVLSLGIGLSMRASEDRIKFSTSLAQGERISFIIKGENCWIDLNGNGKQDAEEGISGSYTQTKTLDKTEQVTIHGTNITKFSCRKKELTELNLYNAPNLEDLNCSDNALRVLDLSSNKKLKRISCNQNKLTRFDLAICKNIEEINCSENSITWIVLPDEPIALESVNCYNNKLKTLDLSKATALYSLDCSGNELTSIKIAPTVPIARLSCENNKLTSLDLSKFPGLKNLDCSNNQLTELLLSNNTKITDLDCASNKLSTLDVSKLSQLNKILIFRNQIGYEAMDKLIQGLNKSGYNKSITLIDTRSSDSEGNTCTKESVAQAKAKGWAVYDHQGGTNDGENKYEGTEGTLPAEQIVMISAKIAGEKIELTVTGEDCWIDLNANNRKDNDEALTSGKAETKIVDGNADKLTIYGRNITTFTCQGQKLTYLNTTKAPKLSDLRCFQNWIVALDLSKNPELRKLICSGNKLSELKLQAQTNLKTLNCSVNQLATIDLAYLTSLQDLDCSANKLTALDVSKNTKISEIASDNNRLTGLDLKGLPTLVKLSVFGNAIDSEGMKTLMGTLPTATKGELFVIDTKNKQEQNVCSVAEVAAAKAKGWAVYDYQGGRKDGKNEYTGTGNAPTSEYITFSTALATGKSITLAMDGRDCWIDLNGNKKKDDGEALEADWTKPAETKTLDKTTNVVIYGKEIKKLLIARNQLTAIDIAQAPMLNRLDCNENNLEDLQLSHPNKVEQLNCYANKLHRLDLAGAAELRSLFCYENRLTALDMSKSTRLTCLSFANNSIATIDLSPLKELDSLYCAHNRLIRLDASNCDKLLLISCFDNRLNDGAIAKLVSTLNASAPKTRKKKELFVIDTKNTNEKNLCTAEDVRAACTKNWLVYDFQGGANAGRNPYKGSETSAESISSSSVSVFPNPATDFVCIEGAQPNQSIRLYSLDGRLALADRTNADGSLRIEFSTVVRGTYILSVGDQDRKIIIK